jgi:hypothetical protein
MTAIACAVELYVDDEAVPVKDDPYRDWVGMARRLGPSNG